MTSFESIPGEKSEEMAGGSTSDSIYLAIVERIEFQNARNKFSISIVPQPIRSGDQSAYDPLFVSFGPYHHGAPGLEAMMNCKWRFLGRILNRCKKMGRPRLLEQCLEKMKEIADKARDCYASDLTMNNNREDLIKADTFVEGDYLAKKIEKGDLTMMNLTVKIERGDVTRRFDRGELLRKTNKFVEMLLLDGCFLIGLLVKLGDRNPSSLESEEPGDEEPHGEDEQARSHAEDRQRGAADEDPQSLPVDTGVKLPGRPDRNSSPEDISSPNTGLLSLGDLLYEDPVFIKWELLDRLLPDLFLLENQLPFFVLESLCNIFGTSGVFKKADTDVLLKSSREYFLGTLLNLSEDCLKYEATGADRGTKIKHLLHFIHMSLPSVSEGENQKPRSMMKPLLHAFNNVIGISRLCREDTAPLPDSHPSQPSEDDFPIIPTVTQLSRAGVKFQMASAKGSFLNVKFREGNMVLGQLKVDDHTNRIFRNLIALEQCFSSESDSRPVVTNYCAFMVLLVNTARDVEILQESGILRNLLGSDDEVAALFNRLGHGILFNLKDIPHLWFATIGACNYTNRRWPKWRANFVGRLLQQACCSSLLGDHILDCGHRAVHRCNWAVGLFDVVLLQRIKH